MARGTAVPKITAISYGRTFNNGNYASSRVDVTCDVRPDDDPVEVFNVLIEMVLDFREQEQSKK